MLQGCGTDGGKAYGEAHVVTIKVRVTNLALIACVSPNVRDFQGNSAEVNKRETPVIRSNTTPFGAFPRSIVVLSSSVASIVAL